ncbi:hypothetical protein GCM10027516_05890 [Niabella aquatica]
MILISGSIKLNTSSAYRKSRCVSHPKCVETQVLNQHISRTKGEVIKFDIAGAMILAKTEACDDGFSFIIFSIK